MNKEIWVDIKCIAWGYVGVALLSWLMWIGVL